MKAMRLALLAAVVAVVGGVSEAKAAFTTKISIGANSITFTDQVYITDGTTYAGDTNLLVAGKIQGTFLIDGFSVTVTSSSNAASPGSLGQLNTNTVTVRNISGSIDTVVVIETTDTGFGFIAPGIGYTATNAVSASALQGSASAVSIVDGTSSSAVSISTVDGASTSFIGTIGSSPFSVYNKLTLTNLTVDIEQNVTISTTVTAVPAPMGLILLASGAPIAGLMGWMRRRRSSEIAA